MKISAIVCTHNGQQVLEKAIQSLVDQTLDKSEYEILIIDNASKDDTREVIRRFENKNNLKYIFEPNLGLSNARNTGWHEGQGKIVAYLDDDAVACPEWLERIWDAFSREPKAGVVGGRVAPIWEAPRPAWLSDKMMGALSVIDWSETSITIGEDQWLVGANISFPRRLLSEIGGFSSDLGRKGKCLLSNEENLLVLKIKEKGYTVFYEPEIMVDHRIPASRLRKSWFRSRYYWQGISDAVLNYRDKTITKKEKKMAIKNQCLQFRKNPSLLFNLLKPTNDKNAWDDKIISYYRLGYIKGIFSL